MSEMNKDEKAETREDAALAVMQSIAKETFTSPLIKQPGDRIEQYKAPHGDVITKINAGTKETVRQYFDKKGKPGKVTATFMQNEREHKEKKRLYHLVGNKQDME